MIAGIDEAGRGPVIGPMVMAIVAVPEKDLSRLDDMGIKDSKLLAPAVRDRLFDEILKFKHSILIVSPEEIDAALESKKTNLNWLEADTAAKLINELAPDKVILDCPSPNIKKYTEYIVNKLDVATDVVAEHKADLNHTIVGAASILAKVTRDREIQKLKEKYKVEFGSGYPADPTTDAFLQKNYDKYPIFRKSWASYKKAKEGKQQHKLGEY